MRRKIEKDYYNLAESCGFRWVGVVLPKNTKDPTWWECEKGHWWQAVYNNIYNGTGCPVCSKKSDSDYRSVGKSKGIIWVGTELPKNVLTKTWWECRRGHRWETTYSVIQKGWGCRQCSNKLRMNTEQDYQNIGKDKKIKWIGEKGLPKTTHCLTWWGCEKGHRWEARYHDIRNASGCPVCNKKSEQEYNNVGKDRIEWVGAVLPNNTKTSTLWKCKKCGHMWEARYGNIHAGSGCPCCDNRINGAKVSKLQLKLNSTLDGNVNFPEEKYRIDIAIIRNGQKIAVEYDSQYWHNGREKEDNKRDKFLVSKGWKILHIKSGSLIPTEKKLKQAIKKVLNSDKICNLYLEDWKK